MHIFNGKKTAEHFLRKLTLSLEEFKSLYNVSPSLAIIRLGHNPASALYVKNKLKIFKELNLNAQEYWFDETISKKDLLTQINILNQDPKTHGIILQLPVPSHMEIREISNHIHPLKDVDGLTVHNQGLLFQNNLSGLYPCTPLGCLLILKSLLKDLSGKRVLVLGRSLLVGKPAALLLMQEHATVTVAHSRSKNLQELIQETDILIAAIGSPHFVQGTWIKKEAFVLDVGITRSKSSSPPYFLGDIAFEKACEKASFITPVPGGIGPITVSCLVYNTFKAAQSLLTQKPVVYDFQRLSQEMICF